MTESAYGDYPRKLCRRHAGPLLILASILLDDTDTADDIVAATARDHRHEKPADRETRTALARSVYHRCLGYLAIAERFPGLTRPKAERPRSPFDRLTAEQRAMVALVVFGGHDIAQTAATLRLPLPALAHRLELMLSTTRPETRRPAVQHRGPPAISRAATRCP